LPFRDRTRRSPRTFQFPVPCPCGVINFRSSVMSGALRSTPKFASARSGGGFSTRKGRKQYLANKTPVIARVYSSLPFRASSGESIERQTREWDFVCGNEPKSFHESLNAKYSARLSESRCGLKRGVSRAESQTVRRSRVASERRNPWRGLRSVKTRIHALAVAEAGRKLNAAAVRLPTGPSCPRESSPIICTLRSQRRANN